MGLGSYELPEKVVYSVDIFLYLCQDSGSTYEQGIDDNRHSFGFCVVKCIADALEDAAGELGVS